MEEPADELEEEPGSFSPELLHGDEDEVAIDPEEDRAELVIYLLACFFLWPTHIPLRLVGQFNFLCSCLYLSDGTRTLHGKKKQNESGRDYD